MDTKPLDDVHHIHLLFLRRDDDVFDVWRFE